MVMASSMHPAKPLVKSVWKTRPAVTHEAAVQTCRLEGVNASELKTFDDRLRW
jgi:hypothetical protein